MHLTLKCALRKTVFVAGAVVLASLLMLFLDFLANRPHMPSFDMVKSSWEISEARLYDRNGELIHEIRIDDKSRRLDWVEIKDISEAMKRAAIAAEDKRFYKHSGVDWLASFSSILKGGPRGASTITMQTAGFVNPGYCGKSRRTLLTKWRQIKGAAKLEASWSKEEILESYLNLASFRGELKGIGATCKGLLSKEPSGITYTEAVILAAMFPGNSSSPSSLSQRAINIAVSSGYLIDPEDISNLSVRLLTRPYFIKPRIRLAPHVARMLLKDGAMKAKCTLDKKIQALAVEILNRRIHELEGKNVNDGAVIVCDNMSGDILAYVASNDETSFSRHVDGIVSRRQAGSTLKPFLYGLALERKLITAASVLEDSPLSIPTQTGIYIPENYSDDYLGNVSVRTSLASSLNVPAVRVLKLTGVASFVERLRSSGFTTIKDDPDYYGFSLALGSADIRLIDLARAYMAIANQGIFKPLRISCRDTNNEHSRIMDETTAFIITDILSDRQARSATFGFENPLSTRFFSAVKTGTSKDMRDNWCIGFSHRYTVGVWMGNFSGEPMWNVSGITGAAVVWMDMMNFLNKSENNHYVKPPQGLIKQKITYSKGIEPERYEWFISGTEPTSDITLSKRFKIPSITYPTPNTVIALDPDIPKNHQKVIFKADNISGYMWRLNGNILGASSSLVWNPVAGNHHLSLIDARNRECNSIDFTVR